MTSILYVATTKLNNMEPTKFLVRPRDYHIFDLDESNDCYRSYSTRSVTYADGTRANASLHMTFDNLVNNYEFMPILPTELSFYEMKHDEYMEYVKWATRSDGHGGSKGGTFEEFLNKKR